MYTEQSDKNVEKNDNQEYIKGLMKKIHRSVQKQSEEDGHLKRKNEPIISNK